MCLLERGLNLYLISPPPPPGPPGPARAIWSAPGRNIIFAKLFLSPARDRYLGGHFAQNCPPIEPPDAN